jgi:CheY-like chemotaxis protein
VVEYRGRRSAPVAIAVAASNPSLFTENRLGTGQAGILNDTGCCNSQANPAVRGSEATVYSTGEGLLRGRVATGSISAYKKPSDYPRPRLPVRLSVGGVPAELVFVAAAPHSVAGVLQINFRVPLNAPIGDAIPLVLTVGNASSSSVATMAVRAMRDQILVAASSARSLERFRAVLAGGGYEVHTARNTAEALVVARRYPVDLVILDQQGSDFDISEMRAARPRLKLIVAVDNLGPEALRLADMLDAQAVVPRPVLSQLLLSRVRELIRRRTPVYDAGDPWPSPGRPLKPFL